LAVPTVWLPKDKIATDKVTAETPVPVRLTVCGLLPASSPTVSAPFRVPVAVGVKITLILHVDNAGRLVPHVLVCA
jgi:hypothetical protein